VFPYGTLKSRPGVDASEEYPYEIPRNLMPTLNDGSPRDGKPTWGRAMEPPAVGFFSERADEVLVKWHGLDTEVRFFGSWPRKHRP
jgi:hypothetical protein